MDPKIIFIIILSIIGFFIQSLFIYVESKKNYIGAVILKGSASLCFLSVGIISYIISKDKNYSILILIGLILGVIGDILLNLRFVVKENKSNLIFIIGTLSFLSGHILYIIAVFKITYVDLVYISIMFSLLITILVGYFIYKKLSVKNGLKIFGIVYVSIVSLFFSIALYNLISEPNSLTILTGLGSLLFYLSDIILIFNSFGKHPRLSLRTTNLLLYFIGQILIGCSLLFI